MFKDFLLKILPLKCENDKRKRLDDSQANFTNHSLINIMKIFGVMILAIIDNIKNNTPTESVIQPTNINSEFNERRSRTRQITKKQIKGKNRYSQYPTERAAKSSVAKRRENYVLEYIEAN